MGNKQHGIYTGAAGTLHVTDADGMVMTPFEVAERLNELTAERDALHRLIESLTPGGSEFHNAPENCAEWVRGRLASVANEVQKRKGVGVERDALRAALESVADTANAYQLPRCSCPDCKQLASIERKARAALETAGKE